MVLLFLGVVLVALAIIVWGRQSYLSENLNGKFLRSPISYQFPYKNPVIEKKRSYRTVIVGDSIVNSLGVNANTLREKLIEYYPDSEFVNYNYGYPSTNILSFPARLIEGGDGSQFENHPILRQGFDLIIIESFGYNPLSDYPLDDGLSKQSEILENSVRKILEEKPNAALAFMTPIAPSKSNFAKFSRDLSPEERVRWVEERIAYIENHKRFAGEKGIPVIDVYTASLSPDGSANEVYISDDFIHPSEEGIELISQEIADYIYENQIFPK